MALRRLATIAFLTAGCGAKDGDSGTYEATPSDAGCGGETVTVAPGLQVACTTGDCALEIVATDPAPPDRGDNTWTVRLVDNTGSDLPVKTLTTAPFMPAHDHGTVPADYAGTLSDSGWSIGPFDLFMPGLWELRTAARLDNNTDVAIVVAFCVEG